MKYNLLFFLLSFSPILWAQEKPIFVGSADNMTIVPSIGSQQIPMIPTVEKQIKDGRSSKIDVVIGKDKQTENDFYTLERNELFQKKKGRTPELVFDAATSNSEPTDPSLAVGPNHVFVVFNTGFIIYDKEGNALTSQLSETNIFPQGGCCDLTVSYDNLADRWVVSLLGNGAYVAVSDGPDPINAQWYVYQYFQVSDYQKVSVWHDGYYMTDNTSQNNKIYIFEREQMLLGNPNAQIIALPLAGLVDYGFYSPQVLNISNDDYPTSGGATVVYYQDDGWPGVSNDHLKLWEINVDWNTPNNSTSSAPVELITTPFISVFDGGSFSNLPQPGGSAIDALQGIIMNQAQYRKFPDHNSAVFNFVIDVDATAAKKAAVRWYELRQDNDNSPWSIYQEGTYTSPDNKHAWNASMVMDEDGNIGMGYTGMGGDNNQKVSSYYTGRFHSDPLNTMTIAEEVIAEGTANILGIRYGDYSKIDIDPSGDKKFWFINEYMNPDRKDVIGVFQIAPNADNDVGVVDIIQPEDGTLTSNETVTVTINNYGINEASNFPVELYRYGTLIATETFTGSIASTETANFTFSQTIDLSTEGTLYQIKACTVMPNDEEMNNNCYTKTVFHEPANDVGITQIISPVSTNEFGLQNITVEIFNYGTQAQTNIPLTLSISPAIMIEETFTGTLNPNSSVQYTFDYQHNFDSYGSYMITCFSNLVDDMFPDNDGVEKQIFISNCLEEQNTESQTVGPDEGTHTFSNIEISNSLTVSDVNVKVNINHTWMSDLEVSLVGPYSNSVILTSDLGGASSLGYQNTIFDDEAAISISNGSPPFTGEFIPLEPLSLFDGIDAQGSWTLSVLDTYDEDQGTLVDWSLTLCGVLDNEEIEIHKSSAFKIAKYQGKQYLIQLNEYQNTDKLDLKIFDSAGSLLKFNTVHYNGTDYQYDLDMSYAPAGTYIVQLGKFSQKIVVN